jgi:hypothetical protein
MWNKQHTDFTNVEITAEFNASELNGFVKSLSSDERGDIGDNVYSVSGIVSHLTSDGFALEGGVFCRVEESLNYRPVSGATVVIKGRFLGYDEIFSEVRLDHVVPL